MKLLDYAPAFTAFVAVVMGLSTAAKLDAQGGGGSHLTPFGWATVVLGLASLVAAVLITRRRQQEARDHES